MYVDHDSAQSMSSLVASGRIMLVDKMEIPHISRMLKRMSYGKHVLWITEQADGFAEFWLVDFNNLVTEIWA